MLLTWVGDESLGGKTNSNYALDVMSLLHFLPCAYAQLLFVHWIREPESNYQADKHVLPWNSPGSPPTWSSTTHWVNTGFWDPWELRVWALPFMRCHLPTISSVPSLPRRIQLESCSNNSQFSFSNILGNQWLAQEHHEILLTKLILICCNFKGKIHASPGVIMDPKTMRGHCSYTKDKNCCNWKLNEILQTKCWAKETRHQGMYALWFHLDKGQKQARLPRAI